MQSSTVCSIVVCSGCSRWQGTCRVGSRSSCAVSWNRANLIVAALTRGRVRVFCFGGFWYGLNSCGFHVPLHLSQKSLLHLGQQISSTPASRSEGKRYWHVWHQNHCNIYFYLIYEYREVYNNRMEQQFIQETINISNSPSYDSSENYGLRAGWHPRYPAAEGHRRASSDHNSEILILWVMELR